LRTKHLLASSIIAAVLTPGSTVDHLVFRLPFLPVPGNHDYYDPGGWGRAPARVPFLLTVGADDEDGDGRLAEDAVADAAEERAVAAGKTRAAATFSS
jgi:hypothetical protein